MQETIPSKELSSEYYYLWKKVSPKPNQKKKNMSRMNIHFPFLPMETRKRKGLFFAGQMTGVEGYVESAASGIVAAYSAAARFRGEEPEAFPRETAIGSLCYYIAHFDGKNFQPMNVNFGLMPQLEKRVPKKEKNQRIADRALEAIDNFIENH